MKEQYLGDVNDYRKYCLLRHFSHGGIRIGVCWMLTGDDGGRDGRKTSYLDDPGSWRDLDPELFDRLKGIVQDRGGRLLYRIEQGGMIPGAAFFNERVPNAADLRRAFMCRALQHLRGNDLIFFDPDNGLEIKSRAKGWKNSSKYLYWDEVTDAFRARHSVLIYQHFTREERTAFTARLARRLGEQTGATSVWSIRTPHVVFLLATSAERVHQWAGGLPLKFGIVTKH